MCSWPQIQAAGEDDTDNWSERSSEPRRGSISDLGFTLGSASEAVVPSLRISLLSTDELQEDLSAATSSRPNAIRRKKNVPPFKCGAWAIGTALFVTGTIAVFVSYSFAPQSLLAPLGAVQFISNVFFTRIVHKYVVLGCL